MEREKKDRRTRKTRQLLRDTLLALLKEKRYDEISVQDISHMIEGYASNMKTKGVTSEVNKTVQSPFGFEMSVMIGKKEN